MSHHLKQLPARLQLRALTCPVARQVGPVANEAGIVALDGVDRMAIDFLRHGTRCTVQMIGESSNRVSHSHHDGSSVLSSEMVVAMSHGNTVSI